LQNLPTTNDPNLLVGTETSDDGGVYQLTEDLAIINTVDYFTPIVDDPYTFGEIAAANSLSDVYSMGGVPKTALNVLYWPKKELPLSILGDILRGGAEKVTEAGAVVVGGHTVDAPELMYGVSVTGTVHPDRVVRNFGAKPGDALILTKRLGIGIITTGLKFDKIGDSVLPIVVESMTRLNASAAAVMQNNGVHACTDITGYGLLGHGFEMAGGNGVTLEFFADKVPYFEDAPQLVKMDTYTRAYLANSEFLAGSVTFAPGVSEEMRHILMEAETSGGLLFALPEENVDAALAELHGADCPEASVVGRVIASSEAHIHVVG
jgi:selenide,water dikinase